MTLSAEAPLAVLCPAPFPAEDLCGAVSPTQEPHALPDVNFSPPALLWVSWNQLLRRAKLTLGNSSYAREQIPPRLLHFQWFLTNYPCPCQVSMGHPITRERLLLLSLSLCLGGRWKGAEQAGKSALGWVHPTQGHPRTPGTRRKGASHAWCLNYQIDSALSVKTTLRTLVGAQVFTFHLLLLNINGLS